ncbi:MAG: hypothetical protein KJ069_14010 [Anaerolineae bacterium]|nr:hypothetical protein [Anaerolineae bacterium]
MIKNITKTENDAWVHFFQRHLVPIVFTFSNGEKVHRGIVTAFVISVLDHWFLITAGVKGPKLVL